MRFQTFLFDLDGTLVDQFEAIHRAHARTMREFGLPPPTREQVRRAVGLGLEHAVAQLFGPAHAALVPQALPVYRAHWAATMLDDVKLMPGAAALLGELKRRLCRIAVVTNKHGPSARQVCAHLHLDIAPADVFGAEDTPWLKPDRRFLDHVMTALGAGPAATLLVGDSPYDVLAAHHAALPCWCVATGTHTADELRAAAADAVYAGLPELGAALGL